MKWQVSGIIGREFSQKICILFRFYDSNHSVIPLAKNANSSYPMHSHNFTDNAETPA